MAKTWLIIEDREDRLLSLWEACSQLAAGDNTVCIWPNTFPEGSASKLDRIPHIRCRSLDQLQDTVTQSSGQGDVIIVFDLDLGEGIHPPDSFETCPLFETWRSLIDAEDRTVVMFIYSTVYAVGKKAKLPLTKKVRKPSRVDATDTSLDVEDPAERTRHARDIIGQALALWERNTKTGLERLWDLSKTPTGDEKLIWFQGDVPAVPVPHSEKMFLKHPTVYRKLLDKGFGFTLPDHWFATPKGFAIFYENLKCMCGKTYFGCATDRATADRNLTVGSVFLIAMMAHYEERADVNVFNTAIHEWDQLPASTMSFLTDQSPKLAQETALSLYYFFREIFRPKNQSTIQACEVRLDGRAVRWSFSWSGNEFKTKWAEADGKELLLPKFEVQTDTFNSIRLLIRYLATNDDGFGHPGHIRMNGKNRKRQVNHLWRGAAGAGTLAG